MSVLALVGLAVLWAIVLVPDVIRRGAASRRSDSIGNFARQLSVLDSSPRPRSNVLPFDSSASRVRNPQPVQPLQPRGGSVHTMNQPVRRTVQSATAGVRSPMQQRRQDVLTVLVAAAGLTFLGTISFGGPMVALNALCDIALVLYLAAMMTLGRRVARPQVTARTYAYPLTSLNSVVPVMSQRRAASR